MADNTTKSAAAIKAAPWVLEWEDLKICIISRLIFEKLTPEEQQNYRDKYGTGLTILDWLQAQKFNDLNLVVFEQMSWKQLPEDTRDKLRDAYGEDNRLLIFADGFLTLTDSVSYPTSQRGNALVFLKLWGRRYIHTQSPSAGYYWRILKTDKNGCVGGYWEKDEDDIHLRKELDQLTDLIWKMSLAIKIENDDPKDNKNTKERDKNGAGASLENLAQAGREELLRRWKKTLQKRYDSLANYELDKVIARIKSIKDEEKIVMNDPEKCAKLVPCLNGIFDLETGKLRSAAPTDLVSYYCPTLYDPAAFDQNVRTFLDRFTDGNTAIEDYLFELLGTAIDSSKRKVTKAMAQLLGSQTNNGKSTLVRALMACLGDASGTGLAQIIRPEAFAKNGSANTTSLTPDFAMISWARFLFISEPKEDLRINWALIKDLTSGGWLLVNPKHKRMYKIPCQFMIFFDTNYYLRVDDNTVFKRGTMKIIPCEHIFKGAERDPDIDKKLSTDKARSYFLRLMLEGYYRYVTRGYRVPPECVQVLAEYEKNSDKLGEFLTQNYIKTGKPSDKIPLKKEIYARYTEWCAENGYKGVESFGEFARKLKNRPGIVIGTRNNAQTLDGWATPENSIKTDPFSGMAPLDWYIKTHTAENDPAEGGGEQQAIDEAEQDKEQAPTLTLEELWRDYAKKIKVADPAADVLDSVELLAELFRRHWRLEMKPDYPEKSIIVGRHILTLEELGKRRAAEAQELHRKIKGNLQQKLDAQREEAQKAIMYLIRTEALAALLGELAEGQATVLTEALLTGGGLDRAIGRQVDIALRSKF